MGRKNQVPLENVLTNSGALHNSNPDKLVGRQFEDLDG
jgi:hypothetical protein